MTLSEDHQRQMPWINFFSHVLTSGVIGFVAFGVCVLVFFFYPPSREIEAVISYAVPGSAIFIKLYSLLAGSVNETDEMKKLPDGTIPILVAIFALVGFLVGNYIGEYLGGAVYERWGSETRVGPRVYMPILGIVFFSYIAVKIGALKSS